MNSIWEQNIKQNQFEQLKGNLKTDVLIIGGGITGILCVYMLKQGGIDCALIEANEICSGITKNTTAKITIQHGLIYDKMIRRFGVEKAQLYLSAQLEATERYKELCQKIECEYEQKDSYVYSVGDRKKIEREVRALERIGCSAKLFDKIKLPFSVAGAVCVPNQAQFHPLRFALELARGLPIYENTKALEIMPNRVITEHGKIDAKKIIVATHFPLLNKHGAYFLKMYQHRSYVIALKNAQDVDGMYVDEADNGMSFRNYKEYLLLGGGGHRTGKKGGNWNELEAFAKAHYPQSIEKARWATQDCMTLDDIPYIGEYSSGTSNLYVATGFNKWGITSAMVSAKILTDLVREKSNDYASVFSPSRSVLRPQLAINLTEALIGWITPTTPRCPHLGCALKYNPQEHSWDCPSHGSRFSSD